MLSHSGRSGALEITDPPEAPKLKWGLGTFSLPLGLAGPSGQRGTLLRFRTGEDCIHDVWIRFALQTKSDDSRIDLEQLRLDDDRGSDLLGRLLSDPELQESMSTVLNGETLKSVLGETTWHMCTASKKTGLSEAEKSSEPTESVRVTVTYGVSFKKIYGDQDSMYRSHPSADTCVILISSQYFRAV